MLLECQRYLLAFNLFNLFLFEKISPKHSSFLVLDAEDASKELNGYRLEDERLIVQVANRARDRSERDSRDSRDTRDSRRDTRDSRDNRDSRRDTRDTRDFDRSDRTRRGTDSAAEPANDRCYNCGEFGKSLY